MKVGDIMVKAVKTCHPDTSLAVAADTMWIHNCGALPVVNDKYEVVGFITDRDICITLGYRNQPASEVAVRDGMATKVHSCAPDDDIQRALKTMEKGRVRRLPVVNREGKLMGILSMDDIVLSAGKGNGKKNPELACEDVVETYKGIWMQ